MNAFLRAWSILIVAAKRLLAQRGLALATLLGLVAAVALTTSIPLYSEAVYYRVLSEGLFSDTPRYRGEAVRPPVTLLFRYVGSFTGPVQWETLQPLDAYFDYDLYRDLRLPPSPDVPQVRMYNSGLFGIYAAGDAEAVTTKPSLFDMSLATMGDVERHLTVVEGRFPAAYAGAGAAAGGATVEVLLSRAFADQLGVQAGETYLAYDLRAQRKFKPDPALFRLHVVGGAAGTALGVLASHVFIPTLQIGAEATARVPPFVVEIAWPALLRVYALFGLLYVVALAVLVRSLLRMRLFDAIKLGETV